MLPDVSFRMLKRILLVMFLSVIVIFFVFYIKFNQIVLRVDIYKQWVSKSGGTCINKSGFPYSLKISNTEHYLILFPASVSFFNDMSTQEVLLAITKTKEVGYDIDLELSLKEYDNSMHRILVSFKHLRSLDLRGVEVSEQEVLRLLEELPQLNNLKVDGGVFPSTLADKHRFGFKLRFYERYPEFEIY